MKTSVYVAIRWASPVPMLPIRTAKSARSGARIITEIPLYARYISSPSDNIIPITPIIYKSSSNYIYYN